MVNQKVKINGKTIIILFTYFMLYLLISSTTTNNLLNVTKLNNAK